MKDDFRRDGVLSALSDTLSADQIEIACLREEKAAQRNLIESLEARIAKETFPKPKGRLRRVAYSYARFGARRTLSRLFRWAR